MQQGYYTIEQWKRPKWVAVAVLPFGMSLTAAEQALKRRRRAGLYRLIHTQRIVWCERDGSGDGSGGVRMRKSHASSPQSLAGMQAMFDRCRGRYPDEEVRAARRDVKQRKRSRAPRAMS